LYHGLSFTRNATSTYGASGWIVQNCTFYGKERGIYVDDGTPATPTYIVEARNNLFIACAVGVYKAVANDGALTSDYNRFAAIATEYTNVTSGVNDLIDVDMGLRGGFDDILLYRLFGWSPYRPLEPIRTDNGVEAYTNPAIGAADTSVSPALDLYGEARPMGGRAGTRLSTYYFDASDAGPTDPDVVWTNDANMFDGDITTLASTTTIGTTTTNELSGEGTNAPASGGIITNVQCRVYLGATTGGTANIRIYADGDLAGTDISNMPAWGSDNIWTTWTTMDIPSNGWTWPKVQALEVLAYAGTGVTLMEIGAVQIRVFTIPAGDDDIGPVEARSRPEQETTTVRTGSNAIKMDGAGYHDILIPVGTSLVTVDVYGRFDSNHTGGKPKLEALEIPGVADQSDIMTGAANTWEAMQVTFTPTAAGIARIRISNADTSATGISFFDDLAVS
jgi:hypothetical protein